LNYFVAFDVDDVNQSRTGGKNKCFWILGAPPNIELRSGIPIRWNRKKLGKFLNAKGADGYDETLEQATCVVPCVLIDP
jgi:hypothetical protein